MRLYNTLTGQKEEFVSLEDKKVKFYSCGPTVYNFFHIGNARPFIIFDALRNFLEYIGYKVTFVQNFTDIDDKTINKANLEGISLNELCKRYISEYFTDAHGLDIKDADFHPKATDNIDAIIEIIEKLEEKGLAYESNGDVYFSTRKFKEYGKLSKQNLDQLESGNRVNLSEKKDDPLDFVLWKGKKSENEPSWFSKWGQGRPGWHIECSAMANKYLGKTIDIHSGGQDLIFPHHENEIAQSEGANGVPFAKYWLHNGYININNNKMSKSHNNFFTVREIAEKYGYEPIRFFMLSSHYRNPINFSKELIEQSKNALTRLNNCIENLEYLIANPADKPETANIDFLQKYKSEFIEALEDDFNTAIAISVIFELVKEINNFVLTPKPVSQLKKCLNMLLELCGVLSLLKKDRTSEINFEIEELIQRRENARKEKDFALADEIRDELSSLGIILEDTKQGVKWKRADK